MATPKRRKSPKFRGIRRRGQRYQVHSVGGMRVAKTFPTLDEAIAWQARKTLELGSDPRAASVLTVREALDLYLDSRPEPRTATEKKALRILRAHLGWWAGRLGHLELSDLKAVKIRQARADHDASAPTKNRYKAALSNACRWMVDEKGWLEANPVRQVSQLKESPPKPRIYTPEETRRLLEACRNSPEWRLYPMVHLSLLMLLRRGELEKLRWSQIDWGRWVLTLGAGDQKARRLTATPIPTLAREILEELRRTRHRPDTDLVFARQDGKRAKEIRGPLRDAYREAGIEDIRQPFHSLRHTGATYFLLNGGNPGVLMQLLRHGSLTMTMRYVTLAAKDLEGELERLGGVWS